MKSNSKLEIACFNVESALIAAEGGADRVEFCAGADVGGTTPKVNDIKFLRDKISIPITIMIRPRGGNFVYTQDEYKQMMEDIEQVKSIGIDALVFGILDTAGNVNIEANKKLVQLAYPLPCTFHRAFDETNDAPKALEDVIECGFKTILTSGHGKTAVDGLEELKILIKNAMNRIDIMPGGGVRSSNIAKLKNELNAHFYHSSAITHASGVANLDEVILLKLNLQN